MENNYFGLKKKYSIHGELFWFTMQILVYKKKDGLQKKRWFTKKKILITNFFLSNLILYTNNYFGIGGIIHALFDTVRF